MKLITNIGRLFTAAGAGTLTDAAVAVDGERIAWVGGGRPPRAVVEAVDEEVDAGGGLVTPGLVDAHTHPLYAGDRMEEIARRSAGAGYAEIAASGGGIGATVRATRKATLADLESALELRLRQWLTGGTTTVEAKTGYHLDRQGELAAVALLDDLRSRPGQPRLSVTFLAAHAVPPEMDGRADDYVEAVAGWCADAAEAGADGCDVFCDEGYFTNDQTRRVLTAGRAAGLVPRVHADELAHTGGALLAAELGAASADHLLKVDETDARAMADAGVVATLSPGTALSLGTLPPARMMADAGVTIALGTDHNAGTCGATSMSLVVALAVAALKLSVDEAVTAATAGGARSLRLDDRGTVEAGKLADLVLWDADHEGAFAWAFGLRPLQVWKGGSPC